MNVSGTGSTLSVVQNGPAFDDDTSGAFLGVGRSGQGSLVVSSGGTVNVLGDDAFVSVSHQQGAAYQTVEESELRIENGGIFNVDSGTYTGGGLNVAHTAHSRGRLVVDGIGSQLNITSDAGASAGYGAFLIVGRRGDGVMDVTNGGQVTVDGNGDLFPVFFVGRGQEDGSVDASAIVTVDGVGSSITLTGDNDTQPGAGGFIAVGRHPNSEGRLIISQWRRGVEYRAAIRNGHRRQG